MLNSFSLAIKSIWANKMRSFLTMLGIIIGVASVIILVGLVQGQTDSMKEEFSSMGTNLITVNVTNLSSRSVDVDDMYGFYEDNSQYFDGLSPVVSVSGTVKVGNENSTSTSISGVSEDYLTMKDDSLEDGRFLQYADILSRQKVCVIGLYVADTYYGSAEAAIGSSIHINGESYEIVGVVERQTAESESMSEGGDDDFIYLPYSAAVKLSQNGVISSYTFSVRKQYENETTTVKGYIEDYLYTIFKDDDLYHVTAMAEMLEMVNSMMSGMELMLGGIAGISLLVAGVGVMNIMLVSVTERTREIGIRKSLGAKKRTILMQFVIEAALTSSLGGVIGILVGIAGTKIVSAVMGTNARATLGAMALSFSISAAIGLAFGYMPAKRAAELNPIDALRTE